MRHITIKTIRLTFLLERCAKHQIGVIASIIRYNLLQKTETFSKESVEMSRRKNYPSLEEFMVDFYREFKYGANQIIDAIDSQSHSILINALKYYKIDYKEFEEFDVSLELNMFLKALYNGYCNGDDVIIDSFESAVKADELLSNMDVSIACDTLHIKCYDNVKLTHIIGDDKILNTANAIAMLIHDASYNLIYKGDCSSKIPFYDFLTNLIIQNCGFVPRIIHFYDKTISVRGANEYKVYSINKIKENLRLWQ